MTNQDWLNLLPSILTMAGWLAAFGIAAWQYKKARNQSLKMEVYKQFLEIYTKLAISITTLKNKGQMIRSKMRLVDEIRKQIDTPERMTFNMSSIDHLDKAFESMNGNLIMLDAWLSAVRETLINSKDIQVLKDKFRKTLNEPWMHLSVELSVTRVRNDIITSDYETLWASVENIVENFEQELRLQAVKVEKWMLTAK